MHVLHISETFVTGVYTYIQSICAFTAQDDRIKTSIIYSPNREGTDELDFEKDFSENVELIPIRMQREISLKKDFKSLKQLQNAVKQIQPDVIHLHSSKAGVLGRLAAKAYPKAKVYYTPNGYAFLREDLSKTKRKFFKLIEKYISKIYGGTTIACGDTEYEYAKRLGKSKMVRNGIDLSELDHIKVKPSLKLNSIVTLGRISAQKNPKLFNAIAEIFPAINFVWIGDGELKHELTAKNIEITGWLDREKALNLLAKHDVYIQTSLWEGLPFTIIEAMALQKPILATDVIGNKDAVVDQKNGFLCDSIGDFENAINQLKTKPQFLRNFGKQSKILAKNKFDRNKNFEQLVEVYLTY
ncbi:glycosyltransferase family 4 protein [Mesohalobacter halotolerans]|uniref:Glycosyltransferase family 4 protein n=1 Tax=Mesohalobacter halotolerans TaxID=1883405 RepID=A0A4U5TWS0_9FLAO|nr:glycosyltransferase family 4 protein [Mesohalobacter halotolerans]